METSNSLAPVISLPEKISLRPPEVTTLSNGVSAWISSGAQQDLIRVQLVMEAGRWFEPKKETAHFTSRLLKSGTKSKTAAQINEEIEFYGASLSVGNSGDWAEVSLFTLTKHLEQMLTLIRSVLHEATFPEDELAHEKELRKHRLSLNREKVDYLAKQAFLETLFGGDHPYGYPRQEGTIDAVTTEDLRRFHADRYTPDQARLFVAGKVSDREMKLIESYLGQGFPARAASPNGQHHLTIEANGLKRFVEKKGAVQASIRMGRKIPMPGHPDYPRLRVLNIVLGGYFGSRLMKNLRETHGYTYGVHSVISHYRHEAFHVIATEVGEQYVDDAVVQIRHELDRLRGEPVPQEELDLMRNFTLGTLLSSTDGPFKTGHVIKDLVMDGRGPGAFDDFVKTIRTITATDLQSLAEEYLDPDDMTLVIAGSKMAQ